jgi:phosphoribosylanthranilate isomerase
MKLKVCGATTLDEINLINQCAVDYIGLWTGITHHPRSLAENKLHVLAAACHKPQPVAVCVRPAYPALGEMLQRCGIHWLQLHGFTTPGDVARLKKQGLAIIKTLHIGDNGDCPELRWLEAYDNAGVDVYLIDRFVDRQQLGSTGQALPQTVIDTMVVRLAGRRVWLAGGITASTISEFAGKPGIEALDVDSAARRNGLIDDPLYRLVQALYSHGEAHG